MILVGGEQKGQGGEAIRRQAAADVGFGRLSF
jgi:hypothetical protein